MLRKAGLLGFCRVVDEGEAVGNAPSGHVVPALGYGQGGIGSEAQVHIFAGQIPERAEILGRRVERSQQGIGGVEGSAARIEDDAGYIGWAAEGNDVMDGSRRKFSEQRRGLSQRFPGLLVCNRPDSREDGRSKARSADAGQRLAELDKNRPRIRIGKRRNIRLLPSGSGEGFLPGRLCDEGVTATPICHKVSMASTEKLPYSTRKKIDVIDRLAENRGFLSRQSFPIRYL